MRTPPLGMSSAFSIRKAPHGRATIRGRPTASPWSFGPSATRSHVDGGPKRGPVPGDDGRGVDSASVDSADVGGTGVDGTGVDEAGVDEAGLLPQPATSAAPS